MRRCVILAALHATLALSPCLAEPMQEPAGPPLVVKETGEAVRLIRTLQLLQDQIARGRPDSEGARRALIEAIAKRLLEAPGEIWTDPSNVDAAILYVLNGGAPAVLDRLPDLDGQHEQLAAAVRAEAMGAGSDALSLWERIDPRALPQSLSAPVALAKATWLIPSDPEAAMRLLEFASLSAPGTLIEEAATRRGIEVAAKLLDAERFERLSIRYATRFPQSAYAAAFRARFSEFYLAVAPSAGDDAAQMLDNILATLPAPDRCGGYVEIARRALIEGEVKLTRSAAERALTLASGPAERARAEFYLGAALALLDDATAASFPVASVDDALLDQRDRDLVGAVRETLDSIRAWPELTQGPPIESPEARSDEEALAETTVAIAGAKSALSAAEQLVSSLDATVGP